MSLARLQSPEPHLVVALVTPFTASGEVDRASLERLVGYLRQNGIDEFFVLGSTGESPLLDEFDRLAIIETVRDAAPRALVYAGVSGMGYRHAIRNSRDALRAGADVAVLMSPFFLSLDQEQLVTYCTVVADDSPMPVALYHHLRMPTPLTVPAIARLAAHPNIVALKDTNGGDHDRCAEILSAVTSHSLLFFQGVEKLVLSTLEAGGHGCVVAQACIAPHLFRALFEAWRSGDRSRTQALQEQLTGVWTIFSRPEVKRSFNHFLHTLKLPLHQRGILTTTAGALPDVRFEPEFDRMITEFMRDHLAPPRA